MEHRNDSTQHKEDAALADIIRFLGGMLLIAGIAILLLGAFGYEQDRKERNAMGRAVATVTGEYVHGGAYYVVYEADGAAHEALMDYPNGKLNPGDQVAIRYDYTWYNDVRQDGPKPLYVTILACGALGLALGGVAMFGQSYLKGRNYDPWQNEEA